MVAKAISTHSTHRSFIILTDVETGRLPENELTKELIYHCDSLKKTVNEQGEKLLGGKHI
ncbi:MAG: hypothetical protein V7K40_23790 [Nostoc sp.]|uniref:hypothetical protein n=1 Tax=Nostoc sp. TaxID=1180 RepID=UPI002FFCA2EA